MIIMFSLRLTSLYHIVRAAGGIERGLQYRIANSVVAAFNWCEITFLVEA